MSEHRPRRHVAPGYRSVGITIPAKLVVELDTQRAPTGGDRAPISRSQAIAVAIRRFLDQGGVALITPEDLVQPYAKPKDDGSF